VRGRRLARVFRAQPGRVPYSWALSEIVFVQACVGKEGTSQSYETPLLLASGALRGWNDALANLRTAHIRYITGRFRDIPT